MRDEFNKNFDSAKLNGLNVEDTWIVIRDLIKDNMEKHIPKIITNEKKAKSSWVNKKVIKQVRKKTKLYSKFLQTKEGKVYLVDKQSDTNNITKGPEYKKYRKKINKCNKIIKKIRKNYENNIANNCKDSPKAFWRYVNERTKSNVGVSALKRENGEYAVSDADKAEVLNNFFASVFIREDVTDIPILLDGEKSNGTTVTDIRVTPVAVEKKLKKLDASKAQGPDGLPPRVFKELASELSLPLAMLYNKSLESNVIPSDWKRADVTAIFKKGSRSEPGNYRPVSLTCIACKILESCVRDVIVSYMNDNNLYAKCQHGFRNKRSCSTQLIEVMEEITELLDNGYPVDIIYLDFRKAFDSVPHNRLLMKIKSYGIVGNVYNWVKDFLTNRIQRVRVGDSYSPVADVLSGIPQGSILGPVLFTIFINDLPESILSPCKIFADDTKIYNSTLNSHLLQNDLNELEDWTKKWNLYFNTEKCKVMHAGRNNPNKEYNMIKNDTVCTVTTCNSEKDLGVIFDKELTFNNHIQTCINKANQMIGLIKRTFINIDNNIFTKLYKALVRPHLEYGNVIWHPKYKYQSMAVERVQRRATKFVKGCKNMDYESRLMFLNLYSLKGRRIRGDLIEAYKIFNGLVDLSWHDLFETSQQSATRNSYGKIFIKRCNTNTRKNCFTNRVANYWNELPFEVKCAPSTNIFKNRLDNIPKFLNIFMSVDKI